MEAIKKNNNKSFTIIESLLAIFILIIGFVSVSQLFPLALRTEKSAEMSTRATELAKSKIEELISKSYDEVKCQASNPPCEQTENPSAEDSAFRRKVSIIYIDPQNNFQEPDPPSTDTGIKKIEVTMFWQSAMGIGESNIQIAILMVRK